MGWFDIPQLSWAVSDAEARMLAEAPVEMPVISEPLVRELVIPEHLMFALVSAANADPSREICCPYGGVSTPDGVVVVTDITGPGFQSHRSWASCDYDPVAMQGWQDSKHALMPMFNRIGTIHTHPGGSAPSGQDIESFAAWLTDPENNADGNRVAAVYGIVGRDRIGAVADLSVYYVDENNLHPVDLPWRSVPSDDPYYLAAIEYSITGEWTQPSMESWYVAPEPLEYLPQIIAQQSDRVEAGSVMATPTAYAGHPAAAPSVTAPDGQPAQVALPVAQPAQPAPADKPVPCAPFAARLAREGLHLAVSSKPSSLQHWIALDDGRPTVTAVYGAVPGHVLLFEGELMGSGKRLVPPPGSDPASVFALLATSPHERKIARRAANRGPRTDTRGIPRNALPLG